MKKDEIFKVILKCADENGIYIFVGDDLPDDVDLTETIIESMQFMSFVLELEEELGVEIPDEYLVYESLKSIASLSEKLEELFLD